MSKYMLCIYLELWKEVLKKIKDKKEPLSSRERSPSMAKWQTLQCFDWYTLINYPLSGLCLYTQLTRQVSNVHSLRRMTNKNAMTHTSSFSWTMTTTTLSLTVQYVSMKWLWTLEIDRKKKMPYHLNLPVRQVWVDSWSQSKYEQTFSKAMVETSMAHLSKLIECTIHKDTKSKLWFLYKY